MGKKEKAGVRLSGEEAEAVFESIAGRRGMHITDSQGKRTGFRRDQIVRHRGEDWRILDSVHDTDGTIRLQLVRTEVYFADEVELDQVMDAKEAADLARNADTDLAFHEWCVICRQPGKIKSFPRHLWKKVHVVDSFPTREEAIREVEGLAANARLEGDLNCHYEVRRLK